MFAVCSSRSPETARFARMQIAVGAVLLVLVPAAAAAQQLPFKPDFAAVHINDTYRVDAVEDGTVGGVGRVVTLVGQVRSQARAPVFVTHGGDLLAPSLESTYWGGLQMVDALNYLHERAPVFIVPGNHEFDDERSQTFVNAVHASRFNWIGTNLRLRTGDAVADAAVRADTIVVLNNVRIGLFGLTRHGEHRGGDRPYAPIDPDYVGLAREAIRGLEQRGADVIIAVTHLEMGEDREIAALRREHPRFIWVAGGHEHYALFDALTDSTAMITKADSNARSAWKVFVTAGDGRPLAHAERVQLDESIRHDRGYDRRIVQRYRAELKKVLPLVDQPIGHTRVRLDGTEENVRNQESNWGNFLADLMRTAYPSVPADVAVLNGGAIRIDDAFAGEIRFEHLYRTFGFPTRVAYVWLRGSELKQYVLEHGVSGRGGEGRFLQVSGVRFRFDRSRPVGDRVFDVQIQQGGDAWAPLDPERVYVVAVPDYLYFGGDGFTFKNRASATIPPGPELKLLAFDYLTQLQSRGESIEPRVEGRIIEVRPES